MSPRLPGGAVPRHYAIELAPDLEAATFEGSLSIDIEVTEPSDTIVLNAAELSIVSAQLVTETGEIVELDPRLDAESERLTLTRRDEPEQFAAGPARLDIAFNGVLNDQLHGFYRSTYTDDAGATHTIATTQFESTDARRAFPCFDEPALKATFATTLIVDEGLLAVSNTAETGREPMEDGRVRVSFATTMVMSTYLVAFVVGPLEVTEAIDCGGVPVRVVHRPGRGDQTAFALDVAAHALQWFANYYGLPYPSDKVDLVAIPDFAFGAMENLGCVTFREVLLLVDPGSASQPELQRVAEVINHELAHMWFGDLVTMAWWEGIWLNEAFATFMETACTDAYRPDWQVWSTFCRSRAS
ncbi:MAG: M1 family metallopeptidase, partial [Acidimicrobiaceae bacterium]|nr:M1 family metallopeptidase [Acidimicrobiaceae bacterium]